MIITRGDQKWIRFVHIFDVCAQCGTMQGPRKYGYDPTFPMATFVHDSPICHRFAFCDIACHNRYWAKRDPERMIR